MIYLLIQLCAVSKPFSFLYESHFYGLGENFLPGRSTTLTEHHTVCLPTANIKSARLYSFLSPNTKMQSVTKCNKVTSYRRASVQRNIGLSHAFECVTSVP